MKIPSRTLVDFVPPEKRAGLPVGTMVRIVQRTYCGRMTANGLCSENCADCKARIVGSFRLDDARNKEALLTWQMKNAVAKAQEEEQAKKKVTIRKDSFGIAVPVSENPFVDLVKEFS